MSHGEYSDCQSPMWTLSTASNFDTGARALAAIEAANPTALWCAPAGRPKGLKSWKPACASESDVFQRTGYAGGGIPLMRLPWIFTGEVLKQETVSMPTLLDAGNDQALTGSL